MRTLKALCALLAAAILAALGLLAPRSVESQMATEAPTGFDNLTNGLVDQATHDADRALFEQIETVGTGLGPTFDGKSCAQCHSILVSGGAGTQTELRAGHMNGNVFVPATAFVNFGQEAIPGRSLINAQGICPAAVESLPASENVHALRLTLNALGDGFVESVTDQTLAQISQSQPAGMQGQLVTVQALGGGTGTGRFGWKDQHVSLLSFSSDSLRNEIGVSNHLAPNTDDVTHQCDGVPDPEDVNHDVDAIARFVRATKAPPRDAVLAATPSAQMGALLFGQIGCAICHVRSIVTATAGTVVAGGTFRVPAPLANKIIYPYSDFLLHDIGTGDGIVQNGPQSTRLKLRTAPLWGVRTRTHLLHDGISTTLSGAIARHGGEAQSVTLAFNGLNPTQKQQLLTFLMSL